MSFMLLIYGGRREGKIRDWRDKLENGVRINI